jgi:5-methylcytosine-specific restriction endonuclease McrA
MEAIKISHMERTHMALVNSTPEQKRIAADKMRAYYRTHPEYRAAVIARSRAQELADPEAKRERDRVYREKNRERLNVAFATRRREWRAAHPEENSLALVAWRLANPDKVTAQRRRSQEKLRVERAMAQRVREKQITGVRIAKEEICNWYTRLCGICELPIEGKFHVDHKIPLAKGGLHEASNLQLAHPFCNLSKHDKIL